MVKLKDSDLDIDLDLNKVIKIMLKMRGAGAKSSTHSSSMWEDKKQFTQTCWDIFKDDHVIRVCLANLAYIIW